MRGEFFSLRVDSILEGFFCCSETQSGLEVIKNFILNSAEHEFLLINVKMPTIFGILTFMSRKISVLGLSEPKKAELLEIFTLKSI